MRKSSAPSLMGLSSVAKKRKFSTPFINTKHTAQDATKPFLSSTVNRANNPVDNKNIKTKAVCSSKSFQNDKRGINSNTTPSGKIISGKISKFSLPPFKTLPAASSPDTQSTSSESVVLEKYFEVVWCKCSSKKNKVWEGDGVLVIKENKVAILLNTEGEHITKSTGCKSTDLISLEVGSLLRVSGKEVEIQNSISCDNFKSGRCFVAAASKETKENIDQHSTSVVFEPVKSKPFKAQKFNKQHNTTKQNTAKTARHNPNSEGALVLLRPSNSSCQGMVVDVVVDPYIALCLRPHQREGVKFLFECVMGMRNEEHTPAEFKGAILADEMGLGKTIQCITLIWTLLKQGFNGRPTVKNVIVVVPNSLVKNWHKEFLKWLGSERIDPFVVSSKNRVDEFLLRPNNRVMIISYEMVVRCVEDIRKVGFDLIICDEAHRLKNNNVKITSLISGLAIPRCVLLTGTPIQNNLEELFTLADLACPSVLGTISMFRQNFIAPIRQGQQPGCSAEEKEIADVCMQSLTDVLERFCLRRTSEVNQKHLPPKAEYVVFIKMTPIEKALYRSLITSQFCQGNSTGSNHLVCIGALKKLCNSPEILNNFIKTKGEMFADLIGCIFDDNSNEDLTTEAICQRSCKLNVVRKFIQKFQANQEKVVLVAVSTKVLDMLEKLCDSIGANHVRLDGKTQSTLRQNVIDRFNSKSSDITVFLLSSKAGGVGLNLTGASRLMLYDIDWNPANDLQAMARIWRDGQKKKVHIYRLLVNGSIEEKIYQRQIIKQNLSGAVIDSLSNKKVQFTDEELKDLFKLKESDTCYTHDLVGCQCFCRKDDNSTVPLKDIHEKQSSSMAEILKWTHFDSKAVNSGTVDGMVVDASITCVFRNVTGT